MTEHTPKWHHRHFPTFHGIFRRHTQRPLHWSEHLGILTALIALTLFGVIQTAELARLRHAVAEREAAAWLTAPYGRVSEPSLLGNPVVCEPAIARWFHGTGPLCDAGLGDAPVDSSDDGARM